MNRIGTPREIRIREMEGFKAFIEVDLADESSRRPYRNLYNTYIEGKLTPQEFKQMLILINNNNLSKKSSGSEETEMHLTADQIKNLFAKKP